MELVSEQCRLFVGYFSELIGKSLNNYITLDFGGGGTIQYQFEQALGTHAVPNLLFYSSDIYRYFPEIYFSAFLGLK